jgi:hypothetical protein
VSPKKSSAPTERLSFTVSTTERPGFNRKLVAYAFDANGALVDSAEVRSGKAELEIPKGQARRVRVFLAPHDENVDPANLTVDRLQRLGAYEPVRRAAADVAERFQIPGIIIDRWPFCLCWVRGRVVRNSDNRAVCDARVHICEVDRIPLWILRLPDLDLFRLRDDLLEVLRNPPIPKPWPPPEPPIARRALRLEGPRVSEAPGLKAQKASASIELSPELHARLSSSSITVVRDALAAHWQLIVPWFCLWPYWWWRFRCDELAVLTTDGQGRFETSIWFPCGGDQPDLYFWVEYDFGGGFETVYSPPIACHTYWNYTCGSEVTIRVTDPRVPGCGDEPDLPGCQVVVLSIGPEVAVRELQANALDPAHEGLTAGGEPFGETLEPRVDFSRTELIVNKNVPYYRWSYRRLSGTDGVSASVDASSVPLNVWTPLARDVYRHYKVGTSYPSERMGPMPTSGPPPIAPAPNLFRIRPVDPPSGPEWVVLNEHIDLATAYFDTASLPGVSPAADLAAGRYELKLELFTNTGALVNWTAKGIDLRITAQDAPFGTGTVTTVAAPDYNRIKNGAGDTIAFRMVVRVDNNRCYSEVLPVGGTVTPDPVCGFHNYSSLLDLVGLRFVARHPHNFATYAFDTVRASGPSLAVASCSGVAGDAGTNGFTETSDFNYEKQPTVAQLLGTCANAAFSESLHVWAMATDGYIRLSGYDAFDHAAFALAVPCAPCECEE